MTKKYEVETVSGRITVEADIIIIQDDGYVKLMNRGGMMTEVELVAVFFRPLSIVKVSHG